MSNSIPWVPPMPCRGCDAPGPGVIVITSSVGWNGRFIERSGECSSPPGGRRAPDGDSPFRHDAEGADDMPAHVRNLVAGCELTVPVRDGRLALGGWQGIYLWEHRATAHWRQVVLTLQGEA